MKTNLDALFKTDPKLELDGQDCPIAEGVSIRVRRLNANNPKTKAAMATWHKPYARQIEMGTLPKEKQDEILMGLFIDMCLVSWEGILDENDKPIECNPKNALDLFKRLPVVFDAVYQFSQNYENYKESVGNF